MDAYQPIYEAVRSRISNFDSGMLIDAISRSFDISHVVEILKSEFVNVAYEHSRPSAIYRPTLQRDGNQWCALYGPDLQVGVAGFGDTPNKAMEDFDQEWHKAIERPG